ncbi:hypothetical protein D3C83_34650 [compost metagenome]
MTLSRVVVLPLKVMRLTKYCGPSFICTVTSTTGASARALPPLAPASGGGAVSISGTCAASASSSGSGSSLYLKTGAGVHSM